MRLGPYELLEEIGRGGMGVVSTARAPDGRLVAIKSLLSSWKPDAITRFEREQRLLGSLGEEAGFVPLLDFGKGPRGPYLVMPFVGGGTLRERLSRGPLPEAEVLGLGIALATALGRAHAQGIVHRDLKPENVLFTEDGRPLVSDLGLAKHYTDEVPDANLSISLTREGDVRGTLGYMAPEQAQNAKGAGPPADVFALGVILYECLSGVPAFASDSALAVMAKLESHDFLPLRKASPKTSRNLVAVVERAMAHDPGARFEHGGALARALAAKDTQPARSGAGRYLAIATALLLALGLSAGATALLLSTRPADGTAATPAEVSPSGPVAAPPPPAPPPRAEDFPAPCGGFLASRETRLASVLGGYEWKVGHPVWRVVPLADGSGALVAGEKTFALYDVATGRQVWNVAAAHGPSVHGVAVAKDGRTAVTSGADNLVKLWALRGSEPPTEVRRFAGHEGNVICVRLSPDERRILSCGDDKTARLWDLESGAALTVLKGHEWIVHSVDFLPDGERAVTGSFDKTIKVWDLGTGRALRTLSSHSDVVTNVVALPDGRLGLSTSQDCSLVLWDLERGEVLGRKRAHDGYPYGLAISADGKRAITAGNEGLVKTWDLSMFSAEKTLKGHVHWAPGCAFLPDGRRALSAAFDRTLRLWDLERGVETSAPAGHRNEVPAVALSPDGQVCVTGGGDATVRRWETASGKEVGRPEPHGGRVASLRFAADGRIVSACADGKVRILSAKGDAPARQIPLEGSVRVACLTANGRSVVAAVEGRGLSLVDTTTKESRALEGHKGEVLCLAVSATGTLAVSGSADGTARLWDLGEKTTVATCTGHTAPVVAVDLSRDGRFVLTGSEDKTVRLWDASTGVELRKLGERAAKLTAVALSPDGERALSADESGAIVISSVASGVELDRIDLEATSGDSALVLAFAPDGRSFVAGTARGVALRFLIGAREASARPGR